MRLNLATAVSMIFLHCPSLKLHKVFLWDKTFSPSISYLTNITRLEEKINKNNSRFMAINKSMSIVGGTQGHRVHFFQIHTRLPLEYILDQLDEQLFEFLVHLHLHSNRKWLCWLLREHKLKQQLDQYPNHHLNLIFVVKRRVDRKRKNRKRTSDHSNFIDQFSRTFITIETIIWYWIHLRFETRRILFLWFERRLWSSL